MRVRSTPATEEKPGGEKDAAEDGDGEGSGSDEGDAGCEKEQGFQEGPDGERGGGVEVAGKVPVAELEVADGGIAVPAFIGVLGPVHPGGEIGEVRGEMDEVKREEERGGCEKQDSEELVGDLVPVRHEGDTVPYYSCG